MRITERFINWAPGLLGATRIIFGALFACHGAQKLFGLFGGMPPGAPPFIVYVAGSIEFFGGLLITLGLLTRPAAFLSSGLMACAYFMGHASGGFWPTANGGELAVMFCWFFLFLSAQGPGAFALDHLLRRGRTMET